MLTHSPPKRPPCSVPRLKGFTDGAAEALDAASGEKYAMDALYRKLSFDGLMEHPARRTNLPIYPHGRHTHDKAKKR